MTDRFDTVGSLGVGSTASSDASDGSGSSVAGRICPAPEASASTPAAIQRPGARIILCNNAFGFWTMLLGRATDQEPAAVRVEMLGHLAPGVTIVPAMVQAVEQAQRAGLTYMKNS